MARNLSTSELNNLQAELVLRAFLAVSETTEKRATDLHARMETTFKDLIAAETSATEDAKEKLRHGNKNVVLTGDKLWKRAKEYKSFIINNLQPLKNLPIPSGTEGETEILEHVRKKFWLKKRTEAAREKKQDPPSIEACPTGYVPHVIWGAYKKLHNHVKLQVVNESAAERDALDESGTNQRGSTVRDKTVSRKKQRQLDKDKETAEAKKLNSARAIVAYETKARLNAQVQREKIALARDAQTIDVIRLACEHKIEGAADFLRSVIRERIGTSARSSGSGSSHQEAANLSSDSEEASPANCTNNGCSADVQERCGNCEKGFCTDCWEEQESDDGDCRECAARLQVEDE